MNDKQAHGDDDPVIFKFSASSNISFVGEEDSGLTWGEWRSMSKKEREEEYIDFIFNTLGVEVWEGE